MFWDSLRDRSAGRVPSRPRHGARGGGEVCPRRERRAGPHDRHDRLCRRDQGDCDHDGPDPLEQGVSGVARIPILAARYEKAVDIEGSGSIHDHHGDDDAGGRCDPSDPRQHGIHQTEGQFYLHDRAIDPFGSLSRLKQQVIGKVTREDHGDLANGMIRLYADSKKARERQGMGFRIIPLGREVVALFVSVRGADDES